MIIPIHASNVGASTSQHTFPPQLAQFGSEEVILIELQGSLEAEGDKQGQTVGKLRIDDATKKSTLRIGHHLLEGKLVNLPKPLAVLHRRPSDTAADGDTSMNDADEPDSKRPHAGWDVVVIVRRKMVFSKRPMPMMDRVATMVSMESKMGEGGK
ncbi:hypothetical protein POSPLADRAFT_1155935 [Postia placenta MAD-698-R-SB12]|uniref:Ctf8-domain-containing protein n=1 Tax=Postia placenta MAD-698-R-SB12 TaxID=670580 RepID=A0A1X6MMN8_9APHY|nr:hypothetical protein POSPLADRAFT_1155935 [Postia placenta MAD-698-R-SB12]OSX57620.1 hypothetical protein POSPLADRAFT_1155935 [Postia placenta MAD-698-R-SB12]